jgi:hypothetical protein
VPQGRYGGITRGLKHLREVYRQAEDELRRLLEIYNERNPVVVAHKKRMLSLANRLRAQELEQQDRERYNEPIDQRRDSVYQFRPPSKPKIGSS